MTTILMTGLSMAAAVVAAELAARAWLRWRAAYYAFAPGQRLLLRLDRDTLPELDPVARFDVNSDGERGADVPRMRRGQTLYRVLVAGGSQPEGYLLDQDTSWPGALHQLLSTPESLQALGASRAHVGSIARSGAGSEALSLLLDRILPRYGRLSAIVILVGASDVLRWLEEGAPSTPSTLPPIAELFRCHPEGPFRWRPGALAITELLRRGHRRLFRPQKVHDRAGRWIGAARAMRSAAKVVRATMPDPEPMLAHFERHFRIAIDRARAQADRVIVVRQSWYTKEPLTPEEAAHMWHGGVGHAWREEIATYYTIEVTSRLMALLDERAARVIAELDVEQIDLNRVLDANLATYYDFFHLTPAGARSVAAAVSEVLLRERTISPAIEGEPSTCAALRAS